MKSFEWLGDFTIHTKTNMESPCLSEKEISSFEENGLISENEATMLGLCYELQDRIQRLRDCSEKVEEFIENEYHERWTPINKEFE